MNFPSKLPKPLQEYIDIPSTPGSRNDRLFNACLQARDIHWSEHEAEDRLLSIANGRDGLSVTEARATIHSAYTKEVRAEPHGFKNGSAPFPTTPRYRPKKEEKPSVKYALDPDFKLPEGLPNGARTFVENIFKPNDRVFLQHALIPDGEDKEKPFGEQRIWDYAVLLKVLDRTSGDSGKIFGSGPGGVFFCVNPLGKTKDYRREDNVADFRHALIEFDSISMEDQYQLVLKSRIPCAAILTSGNRSVHAIVKVGARDIKEYRERVAILMGHFREYGVDPATKDPTRLSRFPGAVRADSGGLQQLLQLKTGCDTYEEWQAEQASKGDELPEQMAIEDLLKFDPKADPSSLIGDRFLCKGSAFIISGQSGIGKSSFGLQMLMCWCVGRDFFGIKAKEPLRIMVVQSENDLGDMAEPFNGIIKGLEFTPAEVTLLKQNFIIHRDTSHTGSEFISMMHTLIAKHRPAVVMIDPLLAVVGEDIGEAKVIGSFFRQGLNALMQVTGVVVIFMHHVPKPKEKDKNQTNKDLSYAGSGSSDLTNWARAVGVLQKLGNLDAFQFVMAKREKRTGMVGDDEKTWADTIEIQHGRDGIYWERMDKGMREDWESSVAERQKHKRGGRPKTTIRHSDGKKNTIKKFLVEHPDASQRELTAKVEQVYSVGESKAREVLADLVEQKIVIKGEPESKGMPAKFTYQESVKECGENPF
jgi:RecA-family ATPase